MKIAIVLVMMLATVGCGDATAPAPVTAPAVPQSPTAPAITPAAREWLWGRARCLDTVAEGQYGLVLIDTAFFCVGPERLGGLPRELIFGGDSRLRARFAAWQQSLLDLTDGGFERLCGADWSTMSVTECEGAEELVRELADQLRDMASFSRSSDGP